MQMSPAMLIDSVAMVRASSSEELFITEKLLANQQMQNAQQVQSVLRKCEQYPTRKENCKKLAPVKA